MFDPPKVLVKKSIFDDRSALKPQLSFEKPAGVMLYIKVVVSTFGKVFTKHNLSSYRPTIQAQCNRNPRTRAVSWWSTTFPPLANPDCSKTSDVLNSRR